MTNLFSKFSSTVLAVTLAVFLVGAALADSASVIAAAKAAGQVGERPDGYLGLVVTPAEPELARAVRETNIKRKAVYGDLAREKPGISIEQVSTLSGEKLIARVSPGQKYLDMYGQWVTKIAEDQ